MTTFLDLVFGVFSSHLCFDDILMNICDSLIMKISYVVTHCLKMSKIINEAKILLLFQGTNREKRV